MENLFATNLVSNFPENVTHQSAIKCLVQLNIYLRRAAIELFLIQACLKVVTQRVRNQEPSRVPSKKVLVTEI